MPPIQAYQTYGHLKHTLWRRNVLKENLKTKFNKPPDNEQTNNQCQNPEKYILCTRPPTDDIHNNNEEDEVKSGSYVESWYIEDYRPAIEDTEDDRKRSAIKKIFMTKVKRGSSNTLFSQNNKKESEKSSKIASLYSKIKQPYKKFKSGDSLGKAKQPSTKSKSNLQQPESFLLNHSKPLKNAQLYTKDKKSKVLKEFKNIFLTVPAKKNTNLSVHDPNKQHDKKCEMSKTSEMEILSNKDQKAPIEKRKLENTQETSKKHKHYKTTDGHLAEKKQFTVKQNIETSCKPISSNIKVANECDKISEKIQNNEFNDLRGFNPLFLSTTKIENNAETSQFPLTDWKLERLCAWLIDVEKHLPTYKLSNLLERDERRTAHDKTSKVSINSKYIKTKKSSQRFGEPNDCENVGQTSPVGKPCRTVKIKSKTKVNTNSNSSMQVCLQKKRERIKTTVGPNPEENKNGVRISPEGNYRSNKIPFVSLTDIILSGKGKKKERTDGAVVGDTNLSSKPLSTTNNWDNIKTYKIPKMKPETGKVFKDSMKGHYSASRFEVTLPCPKIKKGENAFLAKGVQKSETQALSNKIELKTKLHKNKNLKDKKTKMRNKDTTIKMKSGFRKHSHYNLRPHKKCIETASSKVMPIKIKSLKRKVTSEYNTVDEKGLLLSKNSKETTTINDSKSSKNHTKHVYRKPTLKVSINLSVLDKNWVKCNLAHLNESEKDTEQDDLLDCNNGAVKGLVDNSNKQKQTNTESQTDQNKNTPPKEDNVISLVSSNTNVNVRVSVTENIHVAQNLTLLPILIHTPCTKNEPTFAPHPSCDTPNLQNPSYTGKSFRNALCPLSPLPALLDSTKTALFSLASHIPSFSLASLGPSDTDQLPSPESYPPSYSHASIEPPRTIAPSLAPQPPSHSPTTTKPTYPGYASPSKSHTPSTNTSHLHNPPYNDHALLNELFPSSPLSALLDAPNTDYLLSSAPHLSSYSPVSLDPSDTYQIPSPGYHPPSHSPVPPEPPRTNESSPSSQSPSHNLKLPKPCYNENAPSFALKPPSPSPITLDHPYMNLALSSSSRSPSHLFAPVNTLNNVVELSQTFIYKSKSTGKTIQTNTENETFIDELLTEEENARDFHCNFEFSASEENHTTTKNDVDNVVSHVHSSFKKQQLFCREVISNSCKDSLLNSVQCDTKTMKSSARALVCSLLESRATKADSLKYTFVPSQSKKSTEKKTDLSTTGNNIYCSKDSNVQRTSFSGLSDTKNVMGPFYKVNKDNVCGVRSGGYIFGSHISLRHLPNNQKWSISEYKKGQNNNSVSVITAITDASTSNQSISESAGLAQNSQMTRGFRSTDSDQEMNTSLFQLPHQNSLDWQYISANHDDESEQHKEKIVLGCIQNEHCPRTQSNLQDITELGDDYTELSPESDDDIQVVFCNILKPNNNESQPMTEPIISSNSNSLSLDSKYQECEYDQVSEAILSTSPLLIDLTEDSDVTDPTSMISAVGDSTEILLQQTENQETLSQSSTTRMGSQTRSVLNFESYNNYCQATRKCNKKESSEETIVHIDSSKEIAYQGTPDQSSVGSKINCNISPTSNKKENSKNGNAKKIIFPPNTEEDPENLSADSGTQEINSTEVMATYSTKRQLNLTRSTGNKYLSDSENGFEYVARTLGNLHLHDKSSDTEDVTNKRRLDLGSEGISKVFRIHLYST